MAFCFGIGLPGVHVVGFLAVLSTGRSGSAFILAFVFVTTLLLGRFAAFLWIRHVGGEALGKRVKDASSGSTIGCR